MVILAETLYAGVGADQQKILRYWTNYAFLRIIKVYQFSHYVAPKPRGVMPKFGTVFSAFIVDETSVFVCRYGQPF